MSKIDEIMVLAQEYGIYYSAWDRLPNKGRKSALDEKSQELRNAIEALAQPLTDEQYLELLLRTGSKELLHYTAFVNDTLQGRGQMQLLKSAKDIRDFVEAAHGIKKGGVAAKKEN